MAVLTVAAVAVAIITSAVLVYTALSQPSNSECVNRGNSRPPIEFSSPTKTMIAIDNYTATWKVTAIDCQALSGFSAWKATIMKDGQPLSQAVTLVKNTILSFSTNVNLMITDNDGNGKLTAGDTFLVYGLTISHNWKFSLIWGADGSEIASLTWNT